MEIMRHIALVSALLLVLWVFALLIGLFFQLNQIRRNWIEGTYTPTQTNPILDSVLRALGLEHGDRLVHSIALISVVIIWPVSLVFGYPVLAAIREKERNRIKKLQKDQDGPSSSVSNRTDDVARVGQELSQGNAG
ncbi:hypothetical protein [Pseudomonas sp. BGI-2]|uniref:hypothetical protein n=1 Tax=Pseudomonas sp. BGI-2 TaxID=2528211 RepID=UPI0010347674|nr:hypothetical protein [Pseudomonas sp. BGI-2]TBN42342.1 hypothetical protein EYC95_17500 [Pseudomonas sp. BGI-2]